MSQKDDVFARTFKGILIFLGVLTVFIILAANFIAGDSTSQDPQVVEDNIAPVGKVKIAGEEPAPPVATATPAPAAVTPAAAAAPVDGQQVYQTACFACHGTGAAGAPKVGDTSAWEARITQGMETLKQHAIAGYQGSQGYMPPKGGRADLSDAAVMAAIEYMVSQSQ